MVDDERSAARCLRFALVVAAITLVTPVHAQTHTPELQITKTCPPSAKVGDTVTCTITVENQDSLHGVDNLVVTNEVPFPGGVESPVAGCATMLGPGDEVTGSGPDFTSCIAEETLEEACDSAFTSLADHAIATGIDADPIPAAEGGFGGLPVTDSKTVSIIVLCSTPTPTSTPTNTPTVTPTDTPRPLGAGCTLADHCGSGFCVDGVCCEGPCAGPHQACNRTGYEGSCLEMSPARAPLLSLSGLAAAVIALGLVAFQALRKRGGI